MVALDDDARLTRTAAAAWRRALTARLRPASWFDLEEQFGDFAGLRPAAQVAVLRMIERDAGWRLRFRCLGGWHERLIRALWHLAGTRQEGSRVAVRSTGRPLISGSDPSDWPVRCAAPPCARRSRCGAGPTWPRRSPRRA